MSAFQDWAEGDEAPWGTVNDNNDALGQPWTFAQRKAGHSGLNVGIGGGPYTEAITITDQTVACTDDDDTYIVANRSTGVLSAAITTTNWADTATYGRVAIVTFASGVLTSFRDFRFGQGGIFDNAAAPGAVDASAVTYTPTTAADWDGSADPGDVDQALDQLAERVADLEGGGAGDEHYDVDGTPGTDDTYAGRAITGVNAGATIAQWDAVYLASDGEWALADANGTNTYPMRGLAAAAGTDGNPMTVVTEGVIRNDGWAWTVGGMLYLSGTAGGLTQTAPSTSGDKVQQVGFAITADVIYLNVGAATFIEVA